MSWIFDDKPGMPLSDPPLTPNPVREQYHYTLSGTGDYLGETGPSQPSDITRKNITDSGSLERSWIETMITRQR